MSFETMIEEAIETVSTNTPNDLHKESALVWGARACALYQTTQNVDSGHQILSLFNRAESFRSAAMFHASLSGEDGLVASLTSVLDQEREQAIGELLGSEEDGGPAEDSQEESSETEEEECESCEGCSGDCHDEESQEEKLTEKDIKVEEAV